MKTSFFKIHSQNEILCDFNLLFNKQILNNISNELEQLVYDISKHHLTDINNYYIEYEIVKPENLVFNYNNYDFSTLTYLTESHHAFVTTDISFESYKYKKYNKKLSEYEREITFSFPNKMKHIYFNSLNMHGFTELKSKEKNADEEEYVLYINGYKRNNENKISSSVSHFFIIDDNSIYNIVKSKLLTSEFYQKMFILKNSNAFHFLSMIENEYLKNNVIVTDHYSSYGESKSIIKNDFYFTKDISNINNYKIDNRFIQRFVFKNVYNKLICKWIINSCELFSENKGWIDDDSSEDFKIKCINVNNLPHVFNFVINTFELLFKNVKDSYNIPDNFDIEILKCYVTKYSENTINMIDMHKDKSLFTLNIALNCNEEYIGGGTYFEDGLTTQLDIGDMLVHCGNVDHCGLPVTKGSRYILIIFINLQQNANV